MSWWLHAPSFLLATGLLFIPGAAMAWAARLRGLALLAAAPALTVSAVGTSAVASSGLGIPWSIWSCLVMAALLTAVAALTAGRMNARPDHVVAAPSGCRYRASVIAAAALAAILIGGRMLAAIGAPESFSQTFDNVFHLNAIRYILDTGSGSSLTIGNMTGGGFYPAAWHDVVSLLVQLGGEGIPEAVNITNLCIGALVWPAGCLYLTRVIAGPRPAALLSAGILSAAFGAYPLLMIDFGVLYPNFLALSLLPVALAFGVQALRVSPSDEAHVPAAWLLLLAILPGLTLAHTSGTMTLLPLLAPAATIAWWRWNRDPETHHWRWWKHRGARVLLLAGALGAAVILWAVVRPPEEAATWPPVSSPVQAAWDVLASSGINRPESWAVMLLSLMGLAIVVLRRQQLWLAGAYVAGASLFLVAVAMRPGRIRTLLTGVWYNDPQRLAAILPIVILPVAVLGAVHAWGYVYRAAVLFRDRRVGQRNSRMTAGWASAMPTAAAVVTAGVLVVATQQANVEAAQTSAAAKYRIGPESSLVSSDELAVLERLGSEVPKDAVIAGNPWNGSSLAYALADRRTVQLHILGATSEDAKLIYARLNDAAIDPLICPAVRRLGVGFVLDFGHREVNNGEGRSISFEGLDDLAARGVAEPVDAQGTAKLYRITACG